MKKLFVILLVAMSLLTACSKGQNSNQANAMDSVLTIYAYDSFVSWGLGKEAVPAFEKMFQCRVNMITVGDAGNMINRVILEKDNPKADLVIGIDNTFLDVALEKDILQPYKAENLKNIDKKLIFDSSNRLTPYDYGYFAFVYDSEKIKKVPESFNDLLAPEYAKKIIIIDPRTSSPGKGLFLWTLVAMGDKGFETFWTQFKSNILTTPASWDEAYTAFTAGEAPIVLSYATSPAFHFENEKTTRYKAFIPKEGGFRQIEGMGIIKNAKNPELAKKFIEYALTEDFQKHIPMTQWMFPVLESTPLPEGFKYCPKPEKDLTLDLKPEYLSQYWMNKWLNIMTK